MAAKKSDTARKAAEAAAQQALQAKVALVGAIGEAQASVSELQDQRRDLEQRHEQELRQLDERISEAEEQIRQTYQDAVSGGWSAKELTGMGISVPRKRRRRRVAAADVARLASDPVASSAVDDQPPGVAAGQ